MGRKFPVAPTLGTAVCIAAVNVVLAYFLALVLLGTWTVSFGAPVVVALVVVALASGAYSVVAWRDYLRGRR